MLTYGKAVDTIWPHQLDGYYAFRDAVLRGEPPPFGEQVHLGLVLIDDVLSTLEIGDARRVVCLLRKSYPDTALAHVTHRTLAETYLVEGKFEHAYAALLERGIPLDLYVNLARQVDVDALTIETLRRWSRRLPLTKFGMAHREQIEQTVLTDVATYATEHGSSFAIDLWRRFGHSPQSAPSPSILARDDDFIDVEELRRTLAVASMSANDDESSDLFRGYPSARRPMHWPHGHRRIDDAYSRIVAARVDRFYRRAENTVRDLQELPRVNEGNLSEMILLKDLRVRFPEERIVHQARPHWLRPQSIDIYFPGTADRRRVARSASR